MPPVRVEELGRERFLIDLRFRDVEGLIASYLLPGPDGWTMIETGPTSCRTRLVDGVRAAGIEPDEVRRVVVTHIHLDHAGGLGSAAELFPRATLYAHREGVSHLIDPSRLEASARRAWGEAAYPLWGPVLPTPPQRLVALSGGERLQLKDGALLVLNTPGHARHHLAFLDEASRSIFTGDAAGVHLLGAERVRPALPPPDLDLEALLDSVERMREVAPDRLVYTHFGPRGEAGEALAAYSALVLRWRDVALRAAREDPSVEHVAAELDRADAERAGDSTVEAHTELISGTAMAAQGLLRYFRTRGLIT